MKYAKPLSPQEETTLLELMRNNHHYRARKRGHAVLLNAAGTTINEIAAIYRTHRTTVAQWITDWEQLGIVGLFDQQRPGRRKKLTPAEQERALVLLEANPRSAKKAVELLGQETGKRISVATLKRLARSMRLTWKRIKKSIKHKRDEAAFRQAQEEIKALQKQEQQGEIVLYYGDESGFSLEPVVPYAWQPKGQTLAVPCAKSNRLNVLGFMTKANQFESFIMEGRVDTQVVVACLDEFSSTLKKTTWLVIDNAPQHTSKLFKSRLPVWEERGLFIKFLPPYYS